jgi:hypothetical protein
LEARKKADERKDREDKRYNRQLAPVVAKKIDNRAGGFAVLKDDSDEEDVKPVSKKEEWPALGAPSQRVESRGYAAAAAKPVPMIATKPKPIDNGFQVLKLGAKYEKTETPKPFYLPKRISNWADDTDSDDEEEEDRNFEEELKKKSCHEAAAVMCQRIGPEPYVDNSAW